MIRLRRVGGPPRRVATVVLSLLASAALHPTFGVAGDIETTGGAGGAPGTQVKLESPQGMTADALGQVYFAETEEHRVRKLTPAGILSTVAGVGSFGYSGDGGFATDAKLHRPTDVSLDSEGNLYIADSFNHVVRKVDTSGIISTYAGTGVEGYSGDGGLAVLAQLSTPWGIAVDPDTGLLYVSEFTGHRIRIVAPDGLIGTFGGVGTCGYFGDGGFFTGARVCAPSGMSFDTNGNMLFADTYNNVVRRIDSLGRIETVAGTTLPAYTGDEIPAVIASLNWPTGVAIAPGGEIYIADQYNNRIRMIDTGGIIHTVAGVGIAGFFGDGGDARLAQMNLPRGVAFDALGRVLAADSENGRIRRLDQGIISTVAGGGTIDNQNLCDLYGDPGKADKATLCRPAGIFRTPSNYVFFADRDFNRVRRIDPAGRLLTIAGNGYAGFSGDGKSGQLAKVNAPEDVTVDPSGVAYIADTGNHRIRKVVPSGLVISTFAGNGSQGYSGDGGPAASASFSLPGGVAIQAGALYVADTGNHVVRRIDASGVVTTVAGNGTAGYSGDGAAATLAQLDTPRGLAFDTSGNLFIAESGNHTVRRVDTSGTITTVAGNGTAGFSGDGAAATSAQLNAPRGVAADASGGIYIADTSNNRIRKVSSAGIITTVAGTGDWGFSGDGGAATLARLATPTGVAWEPTGNVLVADTHNDRIRRLLSP